MKTNHLNKYLTLTGLWLTLVLISGNAMASPADDIRVDGVSIPGFSQNTLTYDIDSTGSSLDIEADSLRNNHRVSIDGGPDAANTQSATVNGNIDDTITVTVTRPNGNGATDYTLTVVDGGGGGNPPGNMYNAILTNQSADCNDYVGLYDSSGMDYVYGTISGGGYVAGTVLPNQNSFSEVTINGAQNECSLSANMVPNHDFGDSSWRNEVIVDSQMVVSFDRNPANPSSTIFGVDDTDVPFGGGQYNFNGVILNGVPISMDSGFCYQGTGTGVALGCTSANNAHQWWGLVPELTNAALDGQLGHQFNGKYHYHAINTPFQDRNGNGDPVAPAANGSPVVGFAPDGYPIYGHYIVDGQNIRTADSGYSLIPIIGGTRRTLGTSPTPSISTYPLGYFEQDWEYTGTGDLDACNGMVVNGQYGYYSTEDYPYTPPCTWGDRHSSMDGVVATPGAYDNSID